MPPSKTSDIRLESLWADSVSWVSEHTNRIIVALVFGVAIVGMLYALKLVGKKLCNQENPWRTIIGRALWSMRIWFMVPLAAQIVATYAHAPEDVGKTIGFVFIITATFQAALFLRELLVGTIELRATNKDTHGALANAINLVRVLINVVLFVIAVVLILGNLGVNVTGLIAGLGIGGIAIGLAAQGIFRDLFAALSILFDGPFRVGDMIKFGDAQGRVEAIGLKSTRIRSLDGEQIIVSNDKLLGMEVRNLAGIAERRVILKLRLRYASDPAQLEQLPAKLKAVVESVKDCRFDSALLTDFTVEAIVLEMTFYVTRGAAEARNKARHEVMLATMRALAELGVEFHKPEDAA